jgi:hypothetical protein
MTAPADDTTSEDGPGSVRVTVQAVADAVAPNRRATVDLVVKGANMGISAFETSVHTDGGRIEDVTPAGDPAVPVVELRDGDTTAAVAAAMGPESDHTPAETIVIATATVTATAADSLAVSVDAHTEVAPIGDNGERYTVDDCGGVTLAIDTDLGEE